VTFKEDNLRFVLLKAMVDAATKELDEMRADHIGPLLERYDQDGTKSFSVRLPGNGALIGALTLPEPKDKYEVTDEQAFTAWFAENHPDAVSVETIPGEPEHTVVVPATPDETITTINPKHRTAIMKALDQNDDGDIIDTVTGSIVKGVKYLPGKRPDKFAVNYEDKGRDLLAAAYRTGQLDSIVGGTSLPPVNGRVVTERVLVQAPAPAQPSQAQMDAWSDVGSGDDPGPLYPEDVDVPGPEHSDGYPLPGEDTGREFDPGHWGAPYRGSAAGW
jgi:hypothetical protein